MWQVMRHLECSSYLVASKRRWALQSWQLLVAVAGSACLRPMQQLFCAPYATRSDEIYGNSVFGPGARFDTILNVLAAAPQHAAAAENLLHVVFGLSKDFSASGALSLLQQH